MKRSEPGVDPATVQRLVLARLLVRTKRPLSRAGVLQSVAEAISPPLSKSVATTAASAALRACAAAGWTAESRKPNAAPLVTPQGKRVLSGGRPLPPLRTWKHAQQLVALSAMGRGPAAKPLRADDLAALALAQRWIVPESIASLPAVVDYLAWRALGVETDRRFDTEAVQRHLLRALVPADVRVNKTMWRRMLAMRSLDARGYDAPALVRALLCRRPKRRGRAAVASAPANQNDPRRSVQPTLEEFAAAVQAAARLPTVARFHDDRVYIASIWDHLRGGAIGDMALAAFKERLIEAHRDGLLRITRADLVGAMDRGEVERSEARYHDATFHFVALEAGGAG